LLRAIAAIPASASNGPQTQQPAYLDFCLELPPRSLPELGRWLQRYGSDVEVLAPAELRQEHRQQAIAIAQRYSLR